MALRQKLNQGILISNPCSFNAVRLWHFYQLRFDQHFPPSASWAVQPMDGCGHDSPKSPHSKANRMKQGSIQCCQHTTTRDRSGIRGVCPKLAFRLVCAGNTGFAWLQCRTVLATQTFLKCGRLETELVKNKNVFMILMLTCWLILLICIIDIIGFLFYHHNLYMYYLFEFLPPSYPWFATIICPPCSEDANTGLCQVKVTSEASYGPDGNDGLHTSCAGCVQPQERKKRNHRIVISPWAFNTEIWIKKSN